MDLDRARAAANKAVARAARGVPGAGPSRPAKRAARPTASKSAAAGRRGAGSRPSSGARSSPARKATPARKAAAKAPTGRRPVKVVSSTPRRATADPRTARRVASARRAVPARRRAAGPARTGLTALARQAPATLHRYFADTPATRIGVLPAKVAGTRSTRRLIVSAVVLVLVFTIVVARLVDLQILNPAAYAKTAQRTRIEELSADRGSIIDRNGKALALSVPATSIFVDGKVMADAGADPRRDAGLLAPILEPNPALVPARAAAIEATMRVADDRFTYLARQVPAEVADRVKALQAQRDPTDPKGKRNELTGVAFLDEARRFRPAADVARALIGDVTIDGDGQSGFERFYGDALTGQKGRIVIERAPDGATIAASEPIVEPAVRGRDVQLTLDRALQFDTEQILTEQVRSSGAESGIAIVAAPATGEILAMANVDAKREGEKVTDVDVSSRNAAMIDSYEPGSVMKVVTAAAAMEEGVVEPTSVLPVSKTIDVCDHTFGEAEPDHALSGTATVAEIIEKSSNVGTIAMGQKLGRQSLYRYLRAFGFGSPTAIGFPAEVAGRVPNPDVPDQWWCSSDGSVPIGQSVAVTPLQMLQAYNTIANGGIFMPSRLVAATIGADGARTVPPTEPGRRVVSTRTADRLNLILRGVVSGGTGTLAAIPGYTPAGKTGTARRAQAGGTYQGADGKVHYDATFAGFVPAEAPALTVLVLIRDPEQNIYGGTVAAPAFAAIGAAALQHLGVPPPSTDLPAGGTPVANDRSGAGGARPTGGDVLGPGVERLPDGRVRVRPAGEGEPPVTTGPPPPPPTTATTRTATTRRPSGGPSTTRARR